MHVARLRSNASAATARRGLKVELFGLICAKLVFLGLLYFAFFGRPVPTGPSAVSAHVYGETIR